VRRDSPGAAQVAEHLGVDGREQVVIDEIGQLPWRSSARWLGGRVDEDVDAAEFPGDPGDRGPDRQVLGGVRSHGEDPAAALAQPPGRRLKTLRVAGQQRHVRSLGGERVSDGESDAPAAAGHDGALPG
jgi:hypothetical protein